MLKAIFYARFHSERGPTILHHYPPDTSLSASSDLGASESTLSQNIPPPLLNFQDTAVYIIPPYELCNKPLSITTSGHCVLGWPVSIEHDKYPRNRFTFNVCFVLDGNVADEVKRAWTGVVRKTAEWFRSLEEEDGILVDAEIEDEGLKQDVEKGEDTGTVSWILEQVYTQITAYGECCVRVSDVHVLHLRLQKPTPPRSQDEVNLWDVPLFIGDLPGKDEWTWDLVVERIHPYINGVNHIRKIAGLANVELKLVQQTIQELVFHKLVMLLDIFHFQAVYAPTEDLAWFVKDEEMQAECQTYITYATDTPIDLPTHDMLIHLYTSLKPGLSVADFCIAHERRLKNIDIRRFITFGVIKGFLRRAHKYAFLAEPPTPSSEERPRPQTSVHRAHEEAVESFEQAWRKAALSSGWATPPTRIDATLPLPGEKGEEERRREEIEVLRGMLESGCCLDRICIELGIGERKVLEKLRSGMLGEVVVLAR